MSTNRSTKALAPAIRYQVSIPDPNNHLFQVTLTIDQPQADQLLQMPVWIPGSYLVREFAKNLQKLTCSQSGKAIVAIQRDKASWQVRCKPGVTLTVQYEVYAFDSSVRTAWLDTTRGFFNGTSLFLKVSGAEEYVHDVEILAPTQKPDWKLATGHLST